MKFKYLLLLILIMSCAMQANLEQEKENLSQTDLDFSAYSKANGMNKAFIKYAHTDGVLLKPGRMPIVSKEQIRKFYTFDDSSYTLTWAPLAVEVSLAGDMGMTYGTYLFSDSTSTESGTYVSVWKKDENGDWRYILDSGNSGLGK